MDLVKHKYVSELDKETYDKISEDLFKELCKLDLSRGELYEVYERGLNSKVVDLADTIDISRYI